MILLKSVSLFRKMQNCKLLLFLIVNALLINFQECNSSPDIDKLDVSSGVTAEIPTNSDEPFGDNEYVPHFVEVSKNVELAEQSPIVLDTQEILEQLDHDLYVSSEMVFKVAVNDYDASTHDEPYRFTESLEDGERLEEAEPVLDKNGLHSDVEGMAGFDFENSDVEGTAGFDFENSDVEGTAGFDFENSANITANYVDHDNLEQTFPFIESLGNEILEDANSNFDQNRIANEMEADDPENTDSINSSNNDFDNDHNSLFAFAKEYEKFLEESDFISDPIEEANENVLEISETCLQEDNECNELSQPDRFEYEGFHSHKTANTSDEDINAVFPKIRHSSPRSLFFDAYRLLMYLLELSKDFFATVKIQAIKLRKQNNVLDIYMARANGIYEHIWLNIQPTVSPYLLKMKQELKKVNFQASLMADSICTSVLEAYENGYDVTVEKLKENEYTYPYAEAITKYLSFLLVSLLVVLFFIPLIRYLIWIMANTVVFPFRILLFIVFSPCRISRRKKRRQEVKYKKQ